MARFGFKNKKGNSFLYSKKILGIACAALTLILSLVLLSFNVQDPSWFYFSTAQGAIQNIGGMVGAHVAALFFYLFGLSSYLFIPLLAAASYCLSKSIPWTDEIDRFLAGLVLIPITACFFYIYQIGSVDGMVNGGIVGQGFYSYIRNRGIDHFVLQIGIFCTIFAAVLILLRMSPMAVAQKLQKLFMWISRDGKKLIMPLAKMLRVILRVLIFPMRVLFTFMSRLLTAADIKESNQSVFAFEQGSAEDISLESEGFWKDYIQRRSSAVSAEIEKPIHFNSAEELSEKPKTVAQPKKTITRMNYSLPSAALFKRSDKDERTIRADENQQLASVLEEKLERCGVYGEVVSIKPGPIITLFEFQPDIDAKVSKILSLEHDLALALEAMSVRIIAPIPGTAKVGFEVANKQRSTVFLGDVMSSSVFQKYKGDLPFVLGKDTSGENVVVDLSDMPHLLVAGSTGSGKSIALNTMLVSWLCKLTPAELKLVIIDPKRLEFSAYKDIPHLLFPIITDPHRAAPVLRWLVRVMEERYEMMALQGVRSISDYKRLCKEKNVEDELPFIVLMIDELADLMMVARKDVEESITRLAQMARAAGIHLIVATQRPSVDVVTGLIKVNFPSRVSFRVTSKVDSRTILDALGAETLLGKGDMLFVDSHSSRMRRIHGAYVSDAEINAVANHVRAQQKVEYMDLQEAVATYKDELEAADEPLLKEVLSFLEEVDEISISLLQRRFKIGYNRSARLIELLESQGKIMPATGGKMRKVIH